MAKSKKNIDEKFENKEKALKEAVKIIEKKYGKGSIMKLGERSQMNIAVYSTGLLSLDIALGVGGIPKGRVIEIYGPEASGKTTITLHMIAAVQETGGITAFIDAEHALDPIYAEKLGVNINELYISQPDSGEQALEITETMASSGVIDLIVIDSVAALVPKAEIEGEMGDSHMGLHARLMSQALRKLTAITSKHECTIIFINQLRSTMATNRYQPAEVTTGGKALKFYSSLRLEIRRTEWIKAAGQTIGSRTRVKVAKNKVAPPFKEVFFDIMFGEGISKVGDVLDLAAELEVVDKSGAWYSYGETRIGQGRENSKIYLEENPEIMEEIKKKVLIECKLLESDEKDDDKKDNKDNKDDKAKTDSKAKKESKVKNDEDEINDEDEDDIDETEDIDIEEDEEDFIDIE